MFENNIDKKEHIFYNYNQHKQKDLSSNGVGAPSDRSCLHKAQNASLVLSHSFI